tara:strand:+ start:694 stop:903 length:210 start_codon:yes stop_codon:yes gene_type:complete
MKKQFLGIAYVSAWVLIWGTIGSLIDYPLLQSSVYDAGSLGQYSTFSLTAFISIILALIIYPKIFNSES